jgi:hypothetical protein
MNDQQLVAAALAEFSKSKEAGTGSSSIAATMSSSNALKEAPKPSAAVQAKPKKRGRRPKGPEIKFPVEPRVIQVLKKVKNVTDHSYRDFSEVPADLVYVAPTNIDDMSFAQKIHHLLSQEEYKKWIAWLPHGRSFKILAPKMLESSNTLLKYLGHNRYSSFLRQLNNFGFKHISNGNDRNSYYHEVGDTSWIFFCKTLFVSQPCISSFSSFYKECFI